ncbi:MAG TPA: NifU family protein [Limnochordia bacterium]|nr:NifU family protein [Limnochordia bacterium]
MESTVELMAKVQEALDEIRPAIQMDGGDVELVDVTEDGVAQVRMVGACGGCPMSLVTLQAGIERIIKRKVPGITAVQAV